ncbi:MAG: ABC transporter ATP-binding protein [Planctomycetaceae bacterium]|nr:MAG: ABC transporter ATP-binding protein [Planctomycetaceae bacterium]
MPRTQPSSRTRFSQYLERFEAARTKAKRENITVTWHGQEKSRRRTRSFPALFRAFLGLAHPYRRRIGFSLVTLTVATVCGLVPPAATKVVIDNVLGGQPLTGNWSHMLGGFAETPQMLLAWLAGTVVTVSAIATGLSVLGRYQTTRTVKVLQTAMRRRAFDHAMRLPLHRVQGLRAGGVGAIIREDAGGLAELVFALIYNPWRSVIQLTGILTILALTDWRLLLGAFLLFPAVMLTHRTWIGRLRPLFRDIRQQVGEVDSTASEAFSGIRVVRGFARPKFEGIRHGTALDLLARQEMLTWWWSRTVEVAWQLLIPVASAGLLWYGGAQVLAGRITTGELIMFLTYLVMLLAPLESLAQSATGLQTHLAGLDRTLDFLGESPEMPDRAGAVRLDRTQVAGAIELRNVGYRYPNREADVLADISFTTRPGEMTAFVGASGAGKTTLCNLIARFFEPTSGTITLDGRSLSDIELASFRKILGIVEQDVFLFDGTVADNIRYADPGAPMERVHWAANAANANGFIEAMPEGYETAIGERGVRLSGGQRQRIAIARALLADPRILILDEATSNLDTESERAIQEALQALMRGRTSFVIAHRLSTIMHADRIVVLKDGRITEMGTHAELMESSGIYQQMVLVQTAPPTMPTAPGAPGSGAAHSHGGASAVSRPSGHATPAVS